jgi:hypothetical protein
MRLSDNPAAPKCVHLQCACVFGGEESAPSNACSDTEWKWMFLKVRLYIVGTADGAALKHPTSGGLAVASVFHPHPHVNLYIMFAQGVGKP